MADAPEMSRERCVEEAVRRALGPLLPTLGQAAPDAWAAVAKAHRSAIRKEFRALRRPGSRGPRRAGKNNASMT